MNNSNDFWIPVKNTKINIHNIEKPKFNKYNKSKQHDDNITKYKIPIKIWALSDNSLEEMILLYNKYKRNWENDANMLNNIRFIINELSRGWRFDVLNYLRLNNNLFSNKNNYIQKGITPYHNLVWPSGLQIEKMNNDSIEQIKKTFLELQKYGFNVFSSNKNVEYEELFLGALYAPDNLMPEMYKNILYEYFTEEWTNFDYIQNFLNGILNICYKNNIVCDKILFLLNKYNYDATFKIFNWILSMELPESKTIKNNIDITNLVECICKNPENNTDFYKYISKYDIKEIRKNFLRIIFKNYKKWINEWVLIKCDNDITENEYYNNYLNQSYCNLLNLWGIFYSKKIMKNNIIKCVNIILKSNIKYKIIAILYFIENANFDLANLKSREFDLLTNLIKNHFINGKVSIKTHFKTTFCKLLNKFDVSNEEIINFIKLN